MSKSMGWKLVVAKYYQQHGQKKYRIGCRVTHGDAVRLVGLQHHAATSKRRDIAGRQIGAAAMPAARAIPKQADQGSEKDARWSHKTKLEHQQLNAEPSANGSVQRAMQLMERAHNAYQPQGLAYRFSAQRAAARLGDRCLKSTPVGIWKQRAVARMIVQPYKCTVVKFWAKRGPAAGTRAPAVLGNGGSDSERRAGAGGPESGEGRVVIISGDYGERGRFYRARVRKRVPNCGGNGGGLKANQGKGKSGGGSREAEEYPRASARPNSVLEAAGSEG
ncbi:hypothetical protein DFH06DRAFT_1134299 [Mycena polygramma]|nr:hypothetical protein DFH06DRAFT_1134299 [Mycena polygramma]